MDWQADGEALIVAAQGRDNITFAFPNDANHVLKHEPRDRSQLAGEEVPRPTTPQTRTSILPR